MRMYCKTEICHCQQIRLVSLRTYRDSCTPPPICYSSSSETSFLWWSFTRERKRSISFSSRRLLTCLCGQCAPLQTVDQWKKTHYFDRFPTRFCLNWHSKNCSFVDSSSVKMTNRVVHLSMHPRSIDLTIICPPLFCWFSSIPSPIISHFSDIIITEPVPFFSAGFHQFLVLSFFA